MTYAETIAYLQGLEVASGWDLKLERMRAAVALRGHPERRFRSIHVAGTNGKGSTAAMLEAVLRAAGLRTGLYTSPHLIDFTERVRAGGRTIPRDAVVALVAELRAALDPAGIALTHFELTTLLAFEWMARIGVELAVVEVGLGGRLDATNVLTPLAGVITSIGRDHEAFLGNTIAAIAGEKAGIAKADVPLVLGPMPAEAYAVITAHAASIGAPVIASDREATLESSGGRLHFRGPDGTRWRDLRLACLGGFQRTNARTALTVLSGLPADCRVDERAARGGLASVWWPGRLDQVGDDPPVVVDGAHNPDGMEALVRELTASGELPAVTGGRPVTLVFAVMADKDWTAMLAPLVPLVARVVATRVGYRSLDPVRVAEHLAGTIPCDVVEDPRQAVGMACAAARGTGLVLVVGSLFLAGEAYAVLRSEPLFPPWQDWERIGTQARP